MRGAQHLGLCPWLQFAAVTLTAACASIGPATPRLSAEIGSRITNMQAVHMEAVRRYFALERRHVEDFVTEEIAPKFLRNFAERSGILASLARDEKPMELMLEWSSDAHHQIDVRRRELLGSLDEAENMVLSELAREHNQLQRAQALLTSRLQAAADVPGTEEDPAQLTADDGFAATSSTLAKISDVVGSSIRAARAAEGQDNVEAAAKVLGEKLRSELRQLQKPRPPDVTQP